MRISCVNTGKLDKSWVGRELNDAAIAELHGIRAHNGLDLCGEEGEYHTLVTDGPLFMRSIAIRAYTQRSADTLAYMEIQELELLTTQSPTSPSDSATGAGSVPY